MYSEDESVTLEMGDYEPHSESQGQDQGFGLTTKMQSQIAGKMFELGTSKAKEAFSLYGRIDILRPYFDVEPSQVQKRLVSALIPEKLTGTTPIVVSELYGPLMVVLTLIAVMLAGMKVTGQTVQEGTLMGTAIGTCFGYWIGASVFFFGLAYFCDTKLSPIEVLSLCGYGLFGTLLCMGLSTFLITSASNLFFYATWGVLGISSAFRMGYIFLDRTAVRKQGVTVAVVVASVHLLFILYLKFVYHKTYEAAAKINPIHTMDRMAAGFDIPPRQGISRNYVFDEDLPTTHLNSHPETNSLVSSTCQKCSESLHLLVNETSLACYRIEEHIQKTIPHLKSIDKQISSVEGKMEGAGYDADYTTEYLENMDVIPELQNIQGWLKNALINAGKIKDLHDKKQPPG